MAEGTLYRHAQPAPVVPDERPSLNNGIVGFDEGWNACRAAMLRAEPVTTANKLGNSPVIGIDPASGPDRTVEVRYVAPPGYVMVPKEPTESMINAWLSEVANWRGHVAGYKAMLAAAPQDNPALDSVQSVVTVPGKWIPVSEQMPGRYYVLAADYSGRHYPPSQPNTQVGIHDDWFGDGKPTWDDGDGNDLHLKQVTHWMPLPAAPQEVK